MNSLKFLGIFLLMGMCFSCSLDDESTKEQEAQNLEQLFSEIESMATSENCSDSAEWTFTGYGSKACGGPMGYIAYSTKIDTELFLEKVEKHRAAQKEFNQKWGIASDCSVPQQPAGISCENGNPVFEY